MMEEDDAARSDAAGADGAEDECDEGAATARFGLFD